MTPREIAAVRDALIVSPDQARIILILYEADRSMTRVEINQEMPRSGEVVPDRRYKVTRRNDIIGTQLCNIRDKLGPRFLINTVPCWQLSQPARYRVKGILDAL